MEELDAFLDSHPDAREYKRALAVKMALQGYSYKQIMSLLQVSAAFISKWKGVFILTGTSGLKLGYKGSRGYLSPEERAEVVFWLKQKSQRSIGELKFFVLGTYEVEYSSKKSYYTLLQEAGFTGENLRATNQKLQTLSS